MSKRAFITYSSIYGGQSFKLKNKRKAFFAVLDFLTASTVFDKPDEIEMEIFETPEKELDDILISSFEKLFGQGTRLLWLQHYEGGDEEYKWEWRIAFDKVDECLDWFEKQTRFPNYFMQPTLKMNFYFKWKTPRTSDLLPYQEEDSSSLLLFLSKTNTVILNLHFPFESVNEDFTALKEAVLKQLPVELKDKDFRLWVPCKNNETYKQRKI